MRPFWRDGRATLRLSSTVSVLVARGAPSLSFSVPSAAARSLAGLGPHEPLAELSVEQAVSFEGQ